VVHGTVKGLLGLISTLLLIIVAAMAGMAYRLSQGPISLSFLTPTIQEALGRVVGSNLTIGLEDTALVWDGRAETLTIHLSNVHMSGPDGRRVATLPEATVSFAGAPLLLGRVAVSGVRVIRPHLRLLRTAMGTMALGFGDESDADTAALLDRAIGGTLDAPGGGDVTADLAGGGYLRRIEIVGGDLNFEDKELGMSWRAPQVDLLIERTATGVTGSVHGPVLVGSQTAEIRLNGVYRSADGMVLGTAKWAGIRPAYFARILPSLAPLSRLQLMTGGTSEFSYAVDRGLTSLSFDLSGGVGALDASPWIANATKVNSVALKGKLSDGMESLAIDDLRIDLGGPKLAVSAKVTALSTAPRIEFAGHLDDMPVDTAKTLWPAGMAPNARAWIVSNLSGGMLRQADFKAALSTPVSGAAHVSSQPDLESMSGKFRGDGVAVHYFGSLPSARGVVVDATFDKDSLSMEIKSATVAGIDVKGGSVGISGFSSTEQTATIKLDVASTVREALKLIDSKPLGYASALGFDPDRAQGDSTVAIEVAFPLTKSLRLSQLKLHAHAKTTGLAVPKAAFGLDLSDGALDFDVDPHGMVVEGKANLAKIPIELKWRENFAAAPFRSRYEVKATLDAAGRKIVGLDDPALQSPVLDGAIPVNVNATFYESGRGDVDIDADLRPATLHLPSLNWSKAPGVPGTAKAKLKVNAGGIAAVDSFEVTATDMELKGDIAFDAGNRPRRVTVATAKWGHSDFRSIITFKPDGEIHIDVSGASFDASELLNGGDSGGKQLDEGQKLSVDVRKLGRVWLSGDGSMLNVDASMIHASGQWNSIHVNATVGQGKSFLVEVRPATERSRRTLHVTCDDAGAAFGAFGILKTLRGGTLAIDGTYLDSQPKKPLEGQLALTNFRVVKAPLLARVLTIASLTGAGDVLSGDGIHFKRGEAHFTLADDIVTLKEARASGTEIGITAKGQIDISNDRLALEGTIVPAYAINSALGDIPVIGPLFTGEKGGGLFGFNYSVSGPAGNPDVGVNPLSALTPGFLRGLFGIFDSSDGPKVPQTPNRSSGQPPSSQDRTNE
jgi:hypothetical protein